MKVLITVFLLSLVLAGCGPNTQERLGLSDSEYIYFVRCQSNLIKLGYTNKSELDSMCAAEAKAR